MTTLIIPSAAGTYFHPNATALAALVSSLPATGSMADGNWTEATKTLSSQAGTAITVGTLLAGDVLRVTAGTGVKIGFYVVAATTGAGPTSVTLTKSLSTTGGDLATAHDIAFSTTIGVAQEGYLRNPNRCANPAPTVLADGTLYPYSSALGLNANSTLIRRVATHGAMAAATDSLDQCGASGTVTTPANGGMQFLATSLSRAVLEAAQQFEPTPNGNGNTLCWKTAGTTGWILDVTYR